MSRPRILLALTVLVAFLGLPQPSRAAKLDLSALDAMPVFEGGRVQPLQTFARSAALDICGKEKPVLHLRRELNDVSIDDEEVSAARAVFGEDGLEKRKFTATEMLLSWITEPEVWEDIPFIKAEHEALRKKLDLEITNDLGEKLQYVSPRELEECEAFPGELRRVFQVRNTPGKDGKRQELKGVDQLIWDLYQRQSLYRTITDKPLAGLQGLSRFRARHDDAEQAMANFLKMAGFLSQRNERNPQLLENVRKLIAAREKVYTIRQGGQFEIADVEPAVVEMVESSRFLAEYFRAAKDRVFHQAQGSGAHGAQQEREAMTNLAFSTKSLAIHSQAMHLALYDDNYLIRVVPALNAAALEADRDTSNDAQPWLALQTVLFGSKELLADYPLQKVDAVRSTFAALRTTFRDRSATNRAEQVAAAADTFATAMQNLGDQINPLRDKLPIVSVDDKLMEYTAYPPVGATAPEVRYNTVDPFMWSWVISLAAVICFALAFGVLRKPLFWGGMGILGFGLVWTIYGFYLRILVTEWAPVTNMWETVVYVPFFVACLGVWFVLIPLLWQGLAAGWRITAIPGTWEDAPLDESQLRVMSASIWKQLGIVALVPRIALTAFVLWALAFAQYYDGGNTVMNLAPPKPLGQMLSNPNAMVVWVVGLCVLFPTAWYLPRLIISLVSSVVFIPLTLRGRFSEAIDEVYPRKPFGMASAWVAWFLTFVAWFASSGSGSILDESFRPLMPVLRSNFWLTIHVLTIVSSYGAAFLSWAIGNIALGHYLFGKYTMLGITKNAAPGYGPAKSGNVGAITVRPPEETHMLAHYAYKVMQVTVILLAVGTILGGLWADVSWGRFWGWDPKEVFALVSLLIYLAILHGRFAGIFGNFGLVVGTVLGFSAVVFSWYGVNFVLGVGLHSYGFGVGGQAEIGTFIALNWIFLAAAAIRYRIEMSKGTAGSPPDESLAVEVVPSEGTPA